jgi:hypothetical protein
MAGREMQEVDAESLASLEHQLDGRKVSKAFWMGHFTMIEYTGTGKEEHIAEAHMIDEVMMAFCPWFTDDNRVVTRLDALLDSDERKPVPEGVPGVFFPEADPSLGLGGTEITEFGQVVLGMAIKDLGVKEETHNAGKRVNEMLATVGLGPNNNWCAAAFWTWFAEAAAAVRAAGREDKTPIPDLGKPVGGAKATMARFQAAKRWIPASQLRGKMAPTMVPIWDRTPAGKPINSSWEGHIGVCRRVEEDGFYAVEGNNGDCVTDATFRRFDDPRLLGAGVL